MVLQHCPIFYSSVLLHRQNDFKRLINGDYILFVILFVGKFVIQSENS